METLKNNLKYLTAQDVELISTKTNYAVSTIYAVLSGSRNLTKRNKIIFELAHQISKIRQHELEKANEKIEKTINY